MRTEVELVRLANAIRRAGDQMRGCPGCGNRRSSPSVGEALPWLVESVDAGSKVRSRWPR